MGICTAYHDTSCWHSTILGETLLDAICIAKEVSCRDVMDLGHAAQGFLREQNPNGGLEGKFTM